MFQAPPIPHKWDPGWCPAPNQKCLITDLLIGFRRLFGSDEMVTCNFSGRGRWRGAWRGSILGGGAILAKAMK